MFEKIIKQLKETSNLYEKLIVVTEEKFKSIKTQNFEKIKENEKKENLYLYDVAESTEKLIREIKLKCEEKNIEDVKLSLLMEYAMEKEKIEIISCQEKIIELERKLKNNLKMNEYLTHAFVEKNKTILEIAVHIANEETGGEKIFIDEEL